MVTETYYRIGHYLTEVIGLYLKAKCRCVKKRWPSRLHAVLCHRLKSQLQAGQRSQRQVFDALTDKLADKYFCNFSVFQSLPDTWAIGQVLPIMPIHRLNEKPGRRAVLQDLTCDSDGKVRQYVDQQSIETSMPIHEPRAGEPYLLGVFMVGAYQEILGDMHNLFRRHRFGECVCARRRACGIWRHGRAPTPLKTCCAMCTCRPKKCSINLKKNRAGPGLARPNTTFILPNSAAASSKAHI